jgi:hypothetical protein
MRIDLPTTDGWTSHLVGAPAVFDKPLAALRSRVAFAAAHVVADPRSDCTPDAPARLDWDATMAVRRELWSWGLGVADAMDTAQRGMGLDWAATAELITRSAAEARACGGRIACGANTDQLSTSDVSLADVTESYLEQLAHICANDAQPVLMCSRHLAAVATKPEQYQRVYRHLLSQVDRPVILHWLGPRFDPLLRGYWGSEDVEVATRTVLELITEHAAMIDGIKLSLLDETHERRLRSALPAGVRLYTGDDFHYPQLILGDERHSSDALLGVFAAIAPAASGALQALDTGDTQRFQEILAPTVPLAEELFAAPTSRYKTGIAFLAWLRGEQSNFTMVGGQHSGRSPLSLARTYSLADDAGALPDPELAAHRMSVFLAQSGLSR